MNFYITTIRINSIASIGSLNIGNNILSGNQSTAVAADDTAVEPGTVGATEGVQLTPPPPPVHRPEAL